MKDDTDAAFLELYPKFKALYDESLNLGFKPMDCFGIMLGIIAQQYQLYSTKEEFIKFLKEIEKQEWPGENPPPKKPNLKLVH